MAESGSRGEAVLPLCCTAGDLIKNMKDVLESNHKMMDLALGRREK